MTLREQVTILSDEKASEKRDFTLREQVILASGEKIKNPVINENVSKEILND